MSFVLDAQKRAAEQSSPTDAARAAFEAASKRNRMRAIALASVAVILTTFAALWWSLTKAPAGGVESLPAKRTPSTAPLHSSETKTLPKINPRVAVNTAPPRPAKAPPQRVVQRPVRSLNQASIDSQNTLLSFNYSSHIYGSEPESRTVIVDGSKLSQGDKHFGWEVVEISETGVIWDDGRERVEVPILEMWEG